MADFELHITTTVTAKGRQCVTLGAQLGSTTVFASGATQAEAGVALLRELRRMAIEAESAMVSWGVLTEDEAALARQTPEMGG